MSAHLTQSGTGARLAEGKLLEHLITMDDQFGFDG